MNKSSKVNGDDDGESRCTRDDAQAVDKLGYRLIDSRDVFGKENEVVILHQGTAYRLRVTRAGKLILNK